MIITIGSHKGGTGKSTLTTNLAVAYQSTGKSVIVVESDPSVSTTSTWAARREEHDELKPVTVLRKTGRLASTLRDLQQALCCPRLGRAAGPDERGCCRLGQHRRVHHPHG